MQIFDSVEGEYQKGDRVQEDSLTSEEEIDASVAAVTHTRDTNAYDDGSGIDGSSSDERGFVEISS